MSSTYYISQPGAVLRFTGEDHFDFLQGQGSADLRGPAGICRYCLWLDFKGRVLADSFVLRESEETVLLVSYASPADKLIAKFDRHIIADDVEIEDLTSQFKLISYRETQNATAALDELGMQQPGEGGFAKAGDSIYAFRGRRLGNQTLDLMVPVANDCVDPAGSMSEGEAESCRLADGVPLLPRDCPEESINPLELNIFSALSFDKGCYLGQEVVARVHRLGRTTRRLVKVEAGEGASEPLPVHLELSEGQMIHMTSLGDVKGRQVGLGILKRKIVDGPLEVNGLSLNISTTPQS